MCSHRSSEAVPPVGPLACAAEMTSCALFPVGSAIGIISCVIGNDSLFSNKKVWMPEDQVVGTPLYRKFWTKIVAAGVTAPPPELDDDEHDVATIIPTATSTGNLHAPRTDRTDRNERTIQPPRPRRANVLTPNDGPRIPLAASVMTGLSPSCGGACLLFRHRDVTTVIWPKPALTSHPEAAA